MDWDICNLQHRIHAAPYPGSTVEERPLRAASERHTESGFSRGDRTPVQRQVELSRLLREGHGFEPCRHRSKKTRASAPEGTYPRGPKYR